MRVPEWKEKKSDQTFSALEEVARLWKGFFAWVIKLENQRGQGNAGPLGPRSLKAEVRGAWHSTSYQGSRA